MMAAGGAYGQGGMPLGLDLGAGLQAEASRQPEPTPAPSAATPPGETPVPAGEAPPVAKGRPGFGHAGSRAWSLGAAYMNDFEENQGGEFSLSYSHFLGDELEFNLELGGWYFNQEGADTEGISTIMNFRWHFWHDDAPEGKAYDWSVFGEASFGLLFAFDNVPDGGTGFNFLPRLGVGFTKQLDEDGTRLIAGLRWQHLSNGRIEGDERNPSRDSVMVWVGLMFPF
jgi:hypothetical protein